MALAFQVEPLIFKSRLLLNTSSLYSVTIMPLYKVVGKSLSKFPELGSAQTAFNHCRALPPLLCACLDLFYHFSKVLGWLIRLACCDIAVSSKAEL